MTVQRVTLWDLGSELDDLTAALDDADLSPEEQAAAIDEWLAAPGSLHDKVDAYCRLIGHREALADIRKLEAKRLTNLATTDANTAGRLRERLKAFMECHGQQHFETDHHKLALAGNGGLQPLKVPDDPAVLPEQYLRVTYTPDIGAIREALAAGIDVPGCELLPRGTSLRIK